MNSRSLPFRHFAFIKQALFLQYLVVPAQRVACVKKVHCFVTLRIRICILHFCETIKNRKSLLFWSDCEFSDFFVFDIRFFDDSLKVFLTKIKKKIGKKIKIFYRFWVYKLLHDGLDWDEFFVGRAEFRIIRVRLFWKQPLTFADISHFWRILADFHAHLPFLSSIFAAEVNCCFRLLGIF